MPRMETLGLCTVAWHSSQHGVGFGILAGEIRSRGLRPVVQINGETELYNHEELDAIVRDLINSGRVHTTLRLPAGFAEVRIEEKAST